MRRQILMLISLCFLSVVFASPGVAGPVTYRVIDVGDYNALSQALGEPGGGTLMDAAMNNRGDVTGGLLFGSRPEYYRSFLSSNEKITQVGPFDGKFFQAYYINNRGQIVGDSAFLYDKGKVTDLFTVAGMTFARGINDAGVILGGRGESIFEPGVITYDNGVITDLEAMARSLGLLMVPSEFYPVAINNSGEVVFFQMPRFEGSNRDYHWSYFFDGSTILPIKGLIATDLNDSGTIIGYEVVQFYGREYDGYMYRKGIKIALTGFGGNYTKPIAINNREEIIGEGNDASHHHHFFIYRKGNFQDLQQLLPQGSYWTIFQLWDLNDRGQILATGVTGGIRNLIILDPAGQLEEP